MPKPKDDSTNKFLQRIAGRKALAPPPTPRPVIGEHPVRTLMRENRDDETTSQHDTADAGTPVLEATNDSSLLTENIIRNEPPQSSENAVSAAVGDVGKPKKNNTLTASKPPDGYSAPVTSGIDREGTVSGGESGDLRPLTSKEAPAVKRSPEASPTSFISPAINAEAYLSSIKQKYRLNSGEYALYRELYLMTHAVGKTECSFVVSEIMRSTGMLERRVRDNIRRLKKNGWIVLLEGYDFENREKPKYRINTEPGF